MKKFLVVLLVILLIGGTGGGVWYYMNMQIGTLNTQISSVQGELSTAKSQVQNLEVQMKAKTDADAAMQALLGNFDLMAQMTGTGIVQDLEKYYSPAASVEGPVAGDTLREYALAFQRYLKANEGQKVAYPVKFTNGEWTAAVRLTQKEVKTPTSLTASGTIVKATSKMQTEMVMVLAKWESGKIIEQYEFPYDGDVTQTKLNAYMQGQMLSSETTSSTGTTQTGTVQAPETASGTTQNPQTGTGGA